MKRFLTTIAISVLLAFVLKSPAYSKFNSYAQTQCEDAPPPQLAVGKYAEVVKPGYLISYHLNLAQYNITGDIEDNLGEQLVNLKEGDQLLVTRGPKCIDGDYMWSFQPPTSFTFPSSDSLYNYFGWWLYETQNNEYLLLPSENQSESTSITYGLPEKHDVLLDEVSAPIIDAMHQLSFRAGGGGIVCHMQQWETTIYYSDTNDNNENCVEFDLPSDTEAEITIFRPDGTVFSKETQFIQEWSGTPGIGYLLIHPPHAWGLPAGIWIVQVKTSLGYENIAYELKRSPNPQLESTCSKYKPQLLLTGFPASATIELAMGYVIENDASESQKWELSVGTDGGLILALSFFEMPPTVNIAGYEMKPLALFYVANSELTAASGIPIYLWTGYPLCPTPASAEEAENNQLENGAIVTGVLTDSEYLKELWAGNNPVFYAFTGKRDDIVNISLVTLSDSVYRDVGPLDPLLRLIGPDGFVIAENDDAENPKYGQLDSEIANYVLPEDGLYTIIATKQSGEGGYALMLDVIPSQ